MAPLALLARDTHTIRGKEGVERGGGEGGGGARGSASNRSRNKLATMT